MMKQLIQKAKIKFFEPDGVGGPAVYRMTNPFEADPLFTPFRAGSAEQQRIQLLEGQVRQLRADIAQWKSHSHRFACEMRELLTD